MFNEEKFLEEMNNVTTALDSEATPSDIQFEEIAAWVEIDLPDYVLHNDWVILNQGPTNLCVAYWTTAWVNESLHMLWFKADKNPNTLTWYIEKNLDPEIRAKWTYVINWEKWARKLWWIEIYSFLKTIDDLKRSIALLGPVLSWTNKIDWSALRKNKFVAVPGNWGWHKINIIWYNTLIENAVYSVDGREYKDYFIVENTWGDKWGVKWRYYIPFEYAIEILFRTKVSIVINKELNRKYAAKILENIEKEKEKKKITPILTKYEYFDGEQLAIIDQENIGLFEVMQNVLKETGYTPIFRTIIGSNEDRTNARILDVITAARTYERNNVKK